MNIRLWHALLFCQIIWPAPAGATEVNVIGLTSGKAVVTINGGKARTLSAGETGPDKVKLISATSEAAVFEIGGARQTLRMGQSISANFAPTGVASVTLVADGRGHFLPSGSINGRSVKFLVDTGATMISMSNSEAKRLGVNYLQGETGYSSTANGVVPVYKIKLDSVKVGDILLNNVDGLVHEGNNLDIVLLGMSFLNRVEMRRDGNNMTLIKRY
ncbi:MAG: TIGR02281 family clan AA aspartic protease [Burkholderiales bacterium]|nr:TIGR02281 family clan AA aspartic protease [Burkholderiales bacterium]